MALLDLDVATDTRDIAEAAAGLCSESVLGLNMHVMVDETSAVALMVPAFATAAHSAAADAVGGVESASWVECTTVAVGAASGLCRHHRWHCCCWCRQCVENDCCIQRLLINQREASCTLPCRDAIETHCRGCSSQRN